ncbi:hypothetical protein LMG28688_01585 [Paraburkholderia caffeinitolerans]|uniref:Uncharacterized protein n=1 Tax=Paraburkholderia caffeinitolerans TaxID=1723730 RepID=A0A6J5FMK3_9BURK|nr:hypothetical protein [Paraburkholderia caffeinitolerans]CAB3783131.1 hypothetical protein LMG28688_01585 [Paraburkholderia caffeinitolerans]
MATVEKRPLTSEEQAEAIRLEAAYRDYKAVHKGVTQAWLGSASKLGSQGLMGQYLRGIIPLNLKALVAICSQIDAKPEVISPRLMKPFIDMGLATTPEEKKAAVGALTAAVKDYEVDTSPSGKQLSTDLNTPFSQKLAAFRNELAHAEREGRLSEEKLDLLMGVLRLETRAPSPQRHTRKKVLAETVAGQSGGQNKREGSG